jgi:hypothetical protein
MWNKELDATGAECRVFQKFYFFHIFNARMKKQFLSADYIQFSCGLIIYYWKFADIPIHETNSTLFNKHQQQNRVMHPSTTFLMPARKNSFS